MFFLVNMVDFHVTFNSIKTTDVVIFDHDVFCINSQLQRNYERDRPLIIFVKFDGCFKNSVQDFLMV